MDGRAGREGVLGPDHLARAAALLAGGAVLAVPTDTVYGLVCDPRNAAAVERIYAIKQRPAGLELGLLGADAAALAAHGVLAGVAARLADAHWPGALSLVVPVAAGHGFAAPRGATVSLRIPASELLVALLRRTGPLASTSANLHGHPPALSAEDCLPLLEHGVDAVLAGPPAAGGPSTIIDCTEAPPRVLRAGSLGAEALRPYLGG